MLDSYSILCYNNTGNNKGMYGMSKSSKRDKRVSEQKNSSGNVFDDREDIYRGEGLYKLVEELRRLEDEHIQQVKDIDSRYQDVFDGKPYFMHHTVISDNANEIALMRKMIRLLQKINDVLTEMEARDGERR